MHRRRVQQPEGEMQPPMRRIIIDNPEETPDWMVSAGQVSGAAQRRSGRRRMQGASETPRMAAPEGRTEDAYAGERAQAPRERRANYPDGDARERQRSARSKSRA